MIDRLLLDTAFAHAVLNPRDQLHPRAMGLLPRFRRAEIWVTEAVLTELADGTSRLDRGSAVAFIRQAHESPDCRVVPIDEVLFSSALDLYENRSDKFWSLTDCISFEVMRRHGLASALTSDHHFIQAGFRALMLDEP